MQEEIELGKFYRDRVTGFDGIATSRTEYFRSVDIRVGLERKGDAELKYFDAARLELVNEV